MLKTLSKEKVVRQMEGLIVSDMDGEKVMLSIANGKYYNLGDIGGEIWTLIKEPVSIQSLISKLMGLYEVDESTCEQQVVSFLESMLTESLIEVA